MSNKSITINGVVIEDNMNSMNAATFIDMLEDMRKSLKLQSTALTACIHYDGLIESALDRGDYDLAKKYQRSVDQLQQICLMNDNENDK